LKILILGTGYLGGEIASSLSKTNQIVCLDHGNNFSDISSKLKTVQLVKGDITDTSLIKNISNDVDLICYCISTGGVVDCIEKPDYYKKINIDNFKQLLNSIENKHCKFLLLSSVFVYPDSEQNFEYTLPNPITLYGKLRLEQESLLEKSCFPYTILRISNIYGHEHLWETKFDNVIDKFISNALSKKDLTLYGDGKQLVDLLHIKYFINVLTKIIDKKFQNQIYNISNESRISIHEIGKIVENIAKNVYGISIQINHKNTSDTLPNIPSTSSLKIKKDFLWKNDQNIEDEIKLIFDHIKNSKNN